MCGITGIFAYGDSAPPVEEAELLRIREHMVKRGPDGAGLWISPDREVGLAHRRLAIIDLSESGAQPMATADGRLTITFNGEIYNYRELRRELEAKGYVFRSQSDTEVLLHLYADRGAQMVHALRGMFAFGIWDARERTLFLARDPFGIKPLYYADDGKTLRFASQVKALLAGGKVNSEFDPAGVTGFYVWGFVPDPFTICRAIRALPAGSTLWIGRGRQESPRQYFSVRDELVKAKPAPAGSAAEKREKWRALLQDSLRNHLVADVPVGIFLSAGLDSTTITAIATETSDVRLHTLTLGFGEYRDTSNDEVPLAEQVARRYGTQQHTARITKADFDRDLAAILAEMDQPSTDGVNTYFVSKTAAAAGMKVALSGLGGDELFGGYPSFRHIPMIRRYLAFGRNLPALGAGLRRAAAPLLGRLTSPKFASLLEYAGSDAEAYLLRRALFMPWELSAFIDEEIVNEGWEQLRTIPALEDGIAGIGSAHARIAALELQWYMRNQLLRDADWAGMAHSLEIRVPLVDHVLFRALAPHLLSPSPPNKLDFASTPVNPLPNQVLERAKSGFLVPVREWTVARSESGAHSAGRGLRGWARTVLPLRRRKRIVSLVTDAFGGYGGIAQFNRDLISALCAMPEVAAVAAIPRLMPGPPGALPAKLNHLTGGLGGKARYVLAVLGERIRGRPVDLVVCGHINLLPVACIVRLISGAPLLLCIHGIDAWTPPASVLPRLLARVPDRILSVSELTKNRFVAWSGVQRDRVTVLPNAVHLEWYGTAPKRSDLLQRYSLEGKVVIATLGRLVSEERYKGFDQVLDAMPMLQRQIPNLVYLVLGDGTDRSRMERRVAEMGLTRHVVFTGFVAEGEKPDHFRLADAYVMPSRGEGFGIVILEALACGVRVVGSKVDGTREALRDGLLGELVDPDNPEDLRDAVLRALGDPTPRVPDGLEHFSYPQFCHRAARLVSSMMPAARAAQVPLSAWTRVHPGAD